MEQEIMSRLDALASELGVAAEYLFGLYVKQAYIKGIFEAVGIVTGALLLVVGCKIDIKRYEGETRLVSWAFKILLWLVGLWLIAVAVEAAATCYLNPEYWAMKHILEQMAAIR